jgi:hypothetical protein
VFYQNLAHLIGVVDLAGDAVNRFVLQRSPHPFFVGQGHSYLLVYSNDWYVFEKVLIENSARVA